MFPENDHAMKIITRMKLKKRIFRMTSNIYVLKSVFSDTKE